MPDVILATARLTTEKMCTTGDGCTPLEQADSGNAEVLLYDCGSHAIR